MLSVQNPISITSGVLPYSQLRPEVALVKDWL